MNKEEWAARQAQYWDSLAATYDRLYDSAWSTQENTLVASRLMALMPPQLVCNVLELGCGTGLGYDLLTKSAATKIRYTGVDISSRMLAAFERKHPGENINLVNASVEEIRVDQFENIDLVMAIFTSASYVHLPLDSFLWKILGWLNPKGGRLYLSFLNRASLRLAPKWGLRPDIQYASRRTNDGFVPATRYSRSDLLGVARNYDLKASIVSLGPLAGLLELPFAWPLNCFLADFTLGSHTIEMIV
ncbi:class I SAM-dependent DNA methyltransferase [Streptomyces sp. NPDC056785]|uniref:class I SAM-dependent DNA methyltransferase n=1 Tax=Streptomyces sp. NPDC056785 TaxID=3345944 RepID=UPI0036D1CC41